MLGGFGAIGGALRVGRENGRSPLGGFSHGWQTVVLGLMAADVKDIVRLPAPDILHIIGYSS